ncbi:MAG: nucleoside deaminase [Bacteroidia bacterium]
MNWDAFFMRWALQEAQKALEAGEIPVGAVVVCQGEIIAKGHNQVEKLRDASAHAEILALTAAAHTLQAKYLPDCTLYVTLEPCPMCAGALYWFKVGRLVYGASDPQRGFTRFHPPLLHPKTQITSAVLADAAALLLETFFETKRK